MTSEEFYDRYLAPLEDQMIRSVWRIVCHQDDAEDVLQNAIAIVIKKQKRIMAHPNPRALILRVCLDAAYDMVLYSPLVDLSGSFALHAAAAGLAGFFNAPLKNI